MPLPKKCKWDWARALTKTLRQMLQRRGLAYTEVTPVILRKLMECQHGKCALSGVSFTLPTQRELPLGTCLNAWRKPLRDVNRCAFYNSPDLVKVDSREGWIPGNIMLISHSLYDFYMSGRDIAALRRSCLAVADHKILIVQKDELMAAQEYEVPSLVESPEGTPGGYLK